MADRYQDRRYGAASHGRGGEQYESDRVESDPLAELARLIGQTDPFGTAGQPSPQVPPRVVPRQDHRQGRDYRQDFSQDYQQDHQPEPDPDEAPAPAGPPSWIQRANIRREAVSDVRREFPPAPQAETGREDYAGSMHPLHQYGVTPQQAQPDAYYGDRQHYQDEQAYAEPQAALDPSRYDDALYGQLETSLQDLQREPGYPDDPYAYEAGYQEESEEEPAQRRRGPMLAVIAVLALGVLGTAAAYGYRTYFTHTRSGEPPIIKADNSPTKIIPTPSDGSAKMPDRIAQGDGTEKIVPREEQPVDVNARVAGPRVVFPPLNQNANPPSAASVSANAMPPAPPGTGPAAMVSNGTLPSAEPRKIKTFSVKSDEPDTAAVPVNTQAPAAAAKQPAAKSASRTSPTQANASANMPLSLSPQGQPAPAAETRVASTVPTQVLPSAPPAPSGGYMVQVSSQRNEADAQASFRALQNKFPQVLASQAPVIKRADLGEKGVYYRAMVGPFGTSEEAVQFCGNLKNAGGQCVVQRN
ncbi:SPOR domain-containing protein [Bradyrhizobium sp. ARR65]|uniref:SPOR domain-containing protein n=1 Tax=Bradyrhizobium sp. ARR65 TaxID=1040989 RepID=UPI00046512BC|nr:SPOR domain-containing protein [Bradyrhizobium sp. ARR65]